MNGSKDAAEPCGNEGFELPNDSFDSNGNVRPVTAYTLSVAERSLFQRLGANEANSGEHNGSSYRPPSQRLRDMFSEELISRRTRGHQSEYNDPVRPQAHHKLHTATNMPEHQQRGHTSDLDFALARYGYGYPSFDTSVACARYELNPAMWSITLAEAARGNRALSALPTLPRHDSIAPLAFDNHNHDPGSRWSREGLPLHLKHLPDSSHSLYGKNVSNSTSQSQVSIAELKRQTSSSIATSSIILAQPKISQHTQQNITQYATSLAISSDSTFLDPVHIFLRSSCIELFVATQKHLMCPGRGARALNLGQVGLRCAYCKHAPRNELARQAMCFPSKRDTIFESVRNYQRMHLEECKYIPGETKARYKGMLDLNWPNKKSQRFVKAYYAEAATELGLVDTPKGMVFGAPPNRTNLPSKGVMAIIRAAESPATSAAFWKTQASSKDKNAEMMKFEHLASESTRRVITNARKQASPFVYPQDFPTISDFEFLLHKQVSPFRPPSTMLEENGISPDDFGALPGLCCKHCARAHTGEDQHTGMWFPTSFQSLCDTSLSQSILAHIMACPNVSRDVKNAFDELRRLASEHSVTAKRGSKRKFLEKIWGRMDNYYG